jgi:hypothetical protein
MSSRKYVGPSKICRLGPAKKCLPKKKISGALPPNLCVRGFAPLLTQRRHSDTTTCAKNITHTQHSVGPQLLCTLNVISHRLFSKASCTPCINLSNPPTTLLVLKTSKVTSSSASFSCPPGNLSLCFPSL